MTAVAWQEGQKQQEGKGPLAEIEFWRSRNTALSGIYEQINMPKVASSGWVVTTPWPSLSHLTGSS